MSKEICFPIKLSEDLPLRYGGESLIYTYGHKSTILTPRVLKRLWEANIVFSVGKYTIILK